MHRTNSLQEENRLLNKISILNKSKNSKEQSQNVRWRTSVRTRTHTYVLTEGHSDSYALAKRVQRHHEHNQDHLRVRMFVKVRVGVMVREKEMVTYNDRCGEWQSIRIVELYDVTCSDDYEVTAEKCDTVMQWEALVET